MPVLLNPPAFPTPPAPPNAAPENRGDNTNDDAGFARALATASQPPCAQYPTGQSDSAADDKTKAVVEKDADAPAIAILWPFLPPIDLDRIGALRSTQSDRLDPSASIGDAPLETGAAVARRDGQILDDARQLPRAPIAPDPIESALAAARAFAPENRKAAVAFDPTQEGVEPSIAGHAPGSDVTAASTLAKLASRSTLELTAAATRPARTEPTPGTAQDARAVVDSRGSRLEVSTQAADASPKSVFAAGMAKLQDSAATLVGPSKSLATASDPSIASMMAPAAGHVSASDPITVTAPVASAQWTAEVSTKLAQVIVMRQDHAELRLNPPHLGPVEVRVQMTGDQATVLIAAPHAVARDALEQALPQLREALAAQGITLGQATVQGESQSRDPSSHPSARSAEGDSRQQLAAAEAPLRGPRADRLVDTFA